MQKSPVVAVIEPRVLFSQCLLAALRSLDRESIFRIYHSVADWQDAPDRSDAAIVLLCMPSGEGSDAALAAAEQGLTELQALEPPVMFAVMSDREEPERILKALESGARAYIPTSVSLEVAVQILHLVIVGGIFVPASSLVAMASFNGTKIVSEVEDTFSLSARQLSVAKALRKGMPNKLIAYELNMCESTVKVHVRNIMKKLKAKNRTEAALLSNRLFSEDK
ncbi:response regulator transcription factor [Aquabacter sp. CN5-332]